MYKKLLLSMTAGVSAYCVYLAPHTVLLDKHRKILATYRHSKEIPVTKVHRQWLKEVMEDLKLPHNTRKLIQPFTVLGFDIYHAGTLDFNYGAILGLPPNFSFNDVNTISKSDTLLKGNGSEWESIDGHNFLNSLILSEDAQKFAMAREILRLQNSEVRIYSRNLAYVILILILSTDLATKRFRLHEARLIFRRLVYGLFALIAVGVRMAYINYRSCKFDAENDNALSEMGPKYIQGGKEFYEKLLSRNIALRKLLGKKGERLYSANGNQKVFLSHGGIPLYDRKRFFDEKLRSTEQPMEKEFL